MDEGVVAEDNIEDRIEPHNPERGDEPDRELPETSKAFLEEDGVGKLPLPGEAFERTWRTFIISNAGFMAILAVSLGWALASDDSPNQLTISLLGLLGVVEIRGRVLSFQVRRYAKRNEIEDIGPATGHPVPPGTVLASGVGEQDTGSP